MANNAGLTKVAIDTSSLSDGATIAAYLTDSAGALITSTLLGGKQRVDTILPSNFAEDAAHSSGDYGNFILAVRHDADTSMVSADGDYAPLQVTAAGRLKVDAELDVDFDYVYAEDSAHSSGDLGGFVLAVRQDTLANSTSADGDYGAIKLTTLGEVYVHDTDVKTELVAANSSLDAIESDADNIRIAIEALRKLEDAAHSSGDSGVMSLGVRNDAGTVLAGSDGDYIPFSMNASGELRVAATMNEAADYAEDSGHVSGDMGYFNLAVRNDNQGTTVTSANADYSQFSVDDRGAMFVKNTAARSNLQQVVTVGTTAVALPTTPLTNRSNMFVQMLSGGQLYLGSATVTNSGATRGIKIAEGGFVNVDVGPGNLVYGIANAAGKEVAVWEFA